MGWVDGWDRWMDGCVGLGGWVNGWVLCCMSVPVNFL